VNEIAITYLTPPRFAAWPQVGVTIVQETRSLFRWLTWPSVDPTKRDEGAWCPTALEGGRVKGGTGPVSLLVADVDECTEGAIDRSALALAAYAGAVVPTFSATTAQPKHRIVLRVTRPMEAEEFPLAWTKMQRELEAAGIVIDRGCKNRNRLYFACVTPSLERWAELGGARLLTGEPVPVDAMLDVARQEAEEARALRARRPGPAPVRAEGRHRYTRAALTLARAHVETASEGGRHDALLREAFSLARLGLSEHEVRDALLEAFVGAAGEHRRREGEKAIRDAVSARQAQGVG
jgi:hypothetical protein